MTALNDAPFRNLTYDENYYLTEDASTRVWLIFSNCLRAKSRTDAWSHLRGTVLFSRLFFFLYFSDFKLLLNRDRSLF